MTPTREKCLAAGLFSSPLLFEIATLDENTTIRTFSEALMPYSFEALDDRGQFVGSRTPRKKSKIATTIVA
jgi:hypothetical protein